MKEKQTSYNRQFNIFILKKTIRVYLVMFMARLITSSTFFVFSIQSTGIASIPSLAPIMAPMKNDLEQLQRPALPGVTQGCNMVDQIFYPQPQHEESWQRPSPLHLSSYLWALLRHLMSDSINGVVLNQDEGLD